MKSIVKNIHGRINCRANMVNTDKAFGLYRVISLFESSFNNDAEPKYEELRLIQRLAHYNNKCGFYN